MSGEDAVRFARDNCMWDLMRGDVVFIQSNGQIEHPHLHSNETFLSTRHTDGWAVKQVNGDYYYAKIHSDDYITGANPTFRRYSML